MNSNLKKLLQRIFNISEAEFDFHLHKYDILSLLKNKDIYINE